MSVPAPSPVNYDEHHKCLQTVKCLNKGTLVFDTMGFFGMWAVAMICFLIAIFFTISKLGDLQEAKIEIKPDQLSLPKNVVMIAGLAGMILLIFLWVLAKECNEEIDDS